MTKEDIAILEIGNMYKLVLFIANRRYQGVTDKKILIHLLNGHIF